MRKRPEGQALSKWKVMNGLLPDREYSNQLPTRADRNKGKSPSSWTWPKKR